MKGAEVKQQTLVWYFKISSHTEQYFSPYFNKMIMLTGTSSDTKAYFHQHSRTCCHTIKCTVRQTFSETKYAPQQREITALSSTHSHNLTAPTYCFHYCNIVCRATVSLELLTSINDPINSKSPLIMCRGAK